MLIASCLVFEKPRTITHSKEHFFSGSTFKEIINIKVTSYTILHFYIIISFLKIFSTRKEYFKK